MSTVRLSKLHATGNDFLVWSAHDAERRGSTPRRRARRSATATAASAPTA